MKGDATEQTAKPCFLGTGPPTMTDSMELKAACSLPPEACLGGLSAKCHPRAKHNQRWQWPQIHEKLASLGQDLPHTHWLFPSGRESGNHGREAQERSFSSEKDGQSKHQHSGTKVCTPSGWCAPTHPADGVPLRCAQKAQRQEVTEMQGKARLPLPPPTGPNWSQLVPTGPN